MSAAKLSIIVPVGNSSQYIISFLDSIIFQSTDDIEVILVDDRSTDGSMAKAVKYLADYNGRKVFRFAQDSVGGGVNATRNDALDLATGDYICVLDSNDILEPEFCESVYNAARRHKADICAYSYRTEIMGKGESRRKKAPALSNGIMSEEGHRKLLSRYSDHIRHYAFSRKFICDSMIRFPDTGMSEDSCFLICAILKSQRFAKLRKALYRHRVLADDASGIDAGGRFRQRTASFDTIMEFAKRNSLYDTYKEELDYIYLRDAFLTSAFVYAGSADARTYVLEDMYSNFSSTYPDYRSNRHYRRSPKMRYPMWLIRKYPKMAIKYIRRALEKNSSIAQIIGK